MTAGSGEGLGFSPKPIKVQGITINPGDDVLVLIGDEWIRRIYEGVDERGWAWMRVTRLTTALDQLPGPWPPDLLRHPDWLTGFAREIDVSD